MSADDRSDLLTQVHRINADLFVAKQRAQAAGVLRLALYLQLAQDDVVEALGEFEPDKPEVVRG